MPDDTERSGAGKRGHQNGLILKLLIWLLRGKVENSFDSFISESARKAAGRPDVSRLVISNCVMIP